jgi:hypothetical protein
MNRWGSETTMATSALRRRSFAIALAVGLVVGAASTAHAAGVAPGKATPVQREQAQSRFIKGRDLYNAKKYDAALVELNASLDIVASPNARLYVGRCLREMGRLVAAYAELGRSAVEAKELQQEDARYEKTGEAAVEERNKLAPKLAFVEVRITHATESTTLKVSGEDVRRGGWDEAVPVVPGEATILVETPGQAPIKRDVRVAAGEHTQVAIDAGADLVELPAGAKHDEPPTTEQGGRALMRPIAFAAGGVAVAGLVTFFVAGAMANGTYSDLEKACGAGPCPPGHEGDVSAGKTQQTFANVGLVVFGVAGAACVTLYVLGAPKKNAATGATASARVTAGPTFVGLQGSF